MSIFRRARRWAGQGGQVRIEYALILCLLVVVLILVFANMLGGLHR